MQKAKYLMRTLQLGEKRMNKKGQVLDTTINTVITVVSLILVVFALLFGIAALNPPSFFAAGSSSANATQALQDNTTLMISNFSQRLTTVGTVLGVSLILAVIVIIILFASRYRQAAGAGSGSL